MVSHLCLLLLSNLAYFAFILALYLGCQSFMLVTPIQFGLFCIYPCLIFSRSVIYACYSYPIWLILHLSLSYFAFFLALFLGCQSSMLVTSIQFGLFCIYPCLIFRMSVIYACYSYPIWLILHLSLPYF